MIEFVTSFYVGYLEKPYRPTNFFVLCSALRWMIILYEISFSPSAPYNGCPSVRPGDPGGLFTDLFRAIILLVVQWYHSGYMQQSFCSRWQQCNNWTTYLEVLMYYFLYLYEANKPVLAWRGMSCSKMLWQNILNKKRK